MLNKNTDRQTMIGFMLTGALLLFLFLISMNLHGDSRDFFLKEGGLVESASFFAYVLCAAFIIYKRKVGELRHFFFLIIFFMLRELDFDKKFTTMGIFKSRFFKSPDVPVIEKVIGIIIILILVYLVFSIIFRHGKEFIMGLKKRSAVSYGALLTFCLLAFSKSIDGLARKLKKIGIVVSEETSMHSAAVEEILELGVPIIIFLTLYAYFKTSEALTTDKGKV